MKHLNLSTSSLYGRAVEQETYWIVFVCTMFVRKVTLLPRFHIFVLAPPCPLDPPEARKPLSPAESIQQTELEKKPRIPFLRQQKHQ